ncbi:acyl carrier protein [Alkalibacter saccharofermentans]|jgi:acyl carrier protein|uniref:Acyl carrier protein n=1 Tax=Alkalibacter saccharofermentans DSM 14828 TaxID=1120975 RepID=A0A1M4VXC0_9FIRM|nr:acyl carrier protein [Alkalibacter saccharofermentans]SHE73523.1 acyl carrier protein [Alkalibacter saccharofermentans DSM 14828]
MIKEKVIEILVDELGVDAEEVVESANIQDDLGADSLAIVEIVMAFEDEFDIKIPEEDAAKMITVKDIIDYLEKEVG